MQGLHRVVTLSERLAQPTDSRHTPSAWGKQTARAASPQQPLFHGAFPRELLPCSSMRDSSRREPSWGLGRDARQTTSHLRNTNPPTPRFPTAPVPLRQWLQACPHRPSLTMSLTFKAEKSQQSVKSPLQVFKVLEALEVEAEHGRQLLYFHSFLCLLQAAAGIAAELVIGIQGLCGAAAQKLVVSVLEKCSRAAAGLLAELMLRLAHTPRQSMAG